MSDLADHPFSPENIAYESGVFSTASDEAWERWAAEVERLLGHSLDGNDPDSFDPAKTGGDGYSIDEAFNRFSQGASAHAYYAQIVVRDRYHAARGRE